MRVRLIAVFTAVMTVLAVLPAAARPPASTRQAPLATGGSPDGTPAGSQAFEGVGPALPGPDYVVAFDELTNPPRDRRLVADSEGHVLLGNTVEVNGDVIDRLVALDTADGNVAWTLDDIESTCLPTATDDGRIFATLVANSDTSGVNNFSSDPVEIDAATGQIVNRYTSPDVEGERRLNECQNELRLGAGGILVAYTRADDDAVVGIDTTTTPITRAWTYRPADVDDDQGLDRVVLSPDGTTAYVGQQINGSDPRLIQIVAIDVATGAELAVAVVPGTSFVEDGLLHTGTQVLVHTRNLGGHDDPPRVVSLDPDTLDQQWVVTGCGEGDPFDRFGRMAVAAGNVVLNASDTLIAFDLDDGSFVWTAELDGFSNNANQLVVDAAGKVYTSTFGGVPLEIHDGATGQRIFQSPDAEDFLGDGVVGEATLGPILPDGRLYAIHRTADSPSLPVLVAYGSGEARLDGISGDPIEIAIELCQYLFGDDKARTVVLARNDVFADTLAGAPLAGDHSCILFTEGGEGQPINDATLAEIERALPDGATVRVVGGTAAVSSEAAQAVTDAGFVVERLAGPGRIDTAVAISDVVVAENPDTDSAVVAFASDWPDAVTAGALAAAVGAPVLLTGTDDLPQQTSDALARYGTATTNVPGGTAVVSDAVFRQLPGGVRVAGANRHATASAVATQLWGDRATQGAFVLSNLEFDLGWALALAASPLSVRLSAPQLGVRATSLPAETEQYLVDNGVSDPSLIVLGDLTVIADDVITQVQATTGP